MTTRVRPHAGVPVSLARSVDLTVPNRRKERVRRLTERAEMLFVERVVQDGGIAAWRQEAQERFQRARHAAARGRVARTDTAALVVALADEVVRDLCCHLVDRDPQPEWAGLWLHLSRHATPPYRADPLFLLAWTAWRLGDRPLARTAVAAALAEETDHGPARMLAGFVRNAMPPVEVPAVPRPGRT